jgi:GNAT superfamily N-acetyltransferase
MQNGEDDIFALIKKAGLENGGNISWEEYQNSQFNEDEHRYLPSDYFENFEIKYDTKDNYPKLIEIINGLEFREWKYGGFGVFDNEKQVAFADNGSVEVNKNYQKKGIGTELIRIIKEKNPKHRFGNMTPEGRNLMRSYYDKYVSKKYNHGGTIHKGSLVKDAKSGNTPARDLNNYNDVLDIDADGMVGAETGLYAKGGLIAPNGKLSNLTPEQYKLVRTPEFKAWFGDWENDPENASKVVDENGEPLIVYHGTNNDFNEFDTNKQLIGWLGKGFYFTKNKIEAKGYGKKLLKCFLNIRNPFVVEGDKVNPDVKASIA